MRNKYETLFDTLEETFGESDFTFSDYLISRINMDGIDTVFSVTGGGIMFLLDAIYRSEHVRLQSTHHEEYAGVAADGYARSNKPYGIAIGTTGPGVAQLIPAIAAAWQDSVPVLFIAGQVKSGDSSRIQKIFNLRQNGTFEFDSIPSVTPITKYAEVVTSAIDGLKKLEYSIKSMLEGRPGPSLIEIPLDIQGEKIHLEQVRKSLSKIQKDNIQNKIKSSDEKQLTINTNIESSKSPLFLFGAGITRANKIKEYQQLAHQTNIPFVTTQFGKEISDINSDLFIGCPGIKGNRSANLAIQEADLIIIIGTSLHAQICGWESSKFAPNAKKIWFEIDNNIIEARKSIYNITETFNLSVEKSLLILKDNLKNYKNENNSWNDNIKKYKKKYLFHFPKHKSIKDRVCLYKAVSKLSENAGLFSAVTYDAGLLTYVVAQHYHPVHQQQYISSGSFGAMGMAVPYAIGASLGNGIHSKPVLCITGDGSFMMSLSELATLKSSPSSVILIVFNNNGYRSIRITHEKFFDGRIMGTDKSNGLFLPKIKKIASAMDIEYTLIKNISDLDKLFKKISTIKRPKLVIEIQSYNDQLVEPSVISKLNEMGKFETPEISEMYPPIDY